MADKKTNSDLGASQVQAQADKENAQGFRGAVPDQPPNEAFTVAGVTKNPDRAAEAGRPADLQGDEK